LYAEYIFKQSYRPNMSEQEAKELAVYIINQTSRIDPNVGGKICMNLIGAKGLKIINDKEIEEILERLIEKSTEIEYEIQNLVSDIVEKRR